MTVRAGVLLSCLVYWQQWHMGIGKNATNGLLKGSKELDDCIDDSN